MNSYQQLAKQLTSKLTAKQLTACPIVSLEMCDGACYAVHDAPLHKGTHRDQLVQQLLDPDNTPDTTNRAGETYLHLHCTSTGGVLALEVTKHTKGATQ